MIAIYFSFPYLTDKAKQFPMYIREMGFLSNQNHVNRPFGHKYHQILLCTRGSGEFLIHGKKHKISLEDAYFIRSNIPHEYYPVEEPWEIKWIVFERFFLNKKAISIKEIAKKIGFNDPSYFCSVFKKYIGMSPLEFMRNY